VTEIARAVGSKIAQHLAQRNAAPAALPTRFAYREHEGNNEQARDTNQEEHRLPRAHEADEWPVKTWTSGRQARHDTASHQGDAAPEVDACVVNALRPAPTFGRRNENT
jgi:hypothetical protein